MRRLILALSLLALVACKNVPESVAQADVFFDLVDSAKFDSAYDLLVDEEKALIPEADFIKMFSDSLRVPGFDTTESESIVSTKGSETTVRKVRKAVDWNRIDELKPRRPRKEYLAGISPNIPRKRDTTRVVTVVATPKGIRYKVGLADMIALRDARKKVASELASKIKVEVKNGSAENNFGAYFLVWSTVSNGNSIDVNPVVFQIYQRGKLVGTVTTETVDAGGKAKAEMAAYYENGLTPQKLGTNFNVGAVTMTGLSAKVVSAMPANRKELDRLALKSLGLASVPWLY